MPPEYWSNWYGVYHDLGYGEGLTGKKPVADYAICFLLYGAKRPLNRRQATHERYQEYINLVPEEPSPFKPLAEKMPPLFLAAPAPPISVSWGRQGEPNEIDAWMRILWVSNP